MSQVYYKVVNRLPSGKLVSCNAVNPSFQVEYKQGIEVSAPEYLRELGLGLCVFANRARAESFLYSEREDCSGNTRGLELWECTVGYQEWSAAKIPALDQAFRNVIIYGPDVIKALHKDSHWLVFPYETIMTDSVTLLNKLEV